MAGSGSLGEPSLEEGSMSAEENKAITYREIEEIFD
jgi:hypothetical protein